MIAPGTKNVLHTNTVPGLPIVSVAGGSNSAPSLTATGIKVKNGRWPVQENRRYTFLDRRDDNPFHIRHFTVDIDSVNENDGIVIQASIILWSGP